MLRSQVPVLAVSIALASTAAQAQWSQVANGVEYAEFTVSGPNHVFVTRMSRADSSLVLDGMVAQDKASGAREIVSAQAARHEGSVVHWKGDWGWRRDVVAAVNGDFFNVTTGASHGGLLSGGWYLRRYPDFGGNSGMVFKADRSAFVGACIRHAPGKQVVTLAGGAEVEISDINAPRVSDGVVLYTPHDQATTPSTSVEGVEVDVEVASPVGISPLPQGTQGRVVAVRKTKGGTPIAFDHVVLRAEGSAAGTLQNAKAQDSVRIAQQLLHYQLDCNTSNGDDWSGAFASVGGNFRFLKGGQVQSTTNSGLTNKAPRTALAFNSTHLFLVVVDGRTARSVGMNMTELGTFCRDELKAVEAVNQDGGGSSVMWLDGVVKNQPSDGTERPVSNGYQLVRLLPPLRSTKLRAGDEVAATAAAALRLGPGTMYASLASAPQGSQGKVVAHSAAGVQANGKSWWKVSFGASTGWVEESLLKLTSRPEVDAGVPDAGADAGRPGEDAGVDEGEDAGSHLNDADAGQPPGGGPGPRGSDGADGPDEDRTVYGCAAAPGGALWLGGALLAWALRRRRHVA